MCSWTYFEKLKLKKYSVDTNFLGLCVSNIIHSTSKKSLKKVLNLDHNAKQLF